MVGSSGDDVSMVISPMVSSSGYQRMADTLEFSESERLNCGHLVCSPCRYLAGARRIARFGNYKRYIGEMANLHSSKGMILR